MNLRQRWNGFWFTPETPLNLGICRVIFFGVLLFLYVRMPFPVWAELGKKSPFWDPIFPFAALHLPLAPAWALQILQVIWKAALVMTCVGFLTTINKAITCVLGVYLIGLTFNYGKVENETLPMIIMMGVMALSRCGDAFSIDALLRRRAGKPAPLPSGEYRWPVRVAWLLMTIAFCAAGIAKLRYTGIRWATGPGFSLLLIKSHFSINPPHVRWGLFIANHKFLSLMFAGGSLMMELLFPLALFNRRFRWFFPLATFSMQIGIGVLMNIWFIQFLAIYPFWVPWGRLFQRGASPSDSVRPAAANLSATAL